MKPLLNISILFCALFVTGGFAQTPPSSFESADTSGKGDLAKLDKLRAQNVLLDAQVKNAELSSKLQEITERKNTPGASPNGAAAAIAGIPPARTAEVVEVAGFDHKMTAKIALPNGGQVVNAQVGTKIDGLGTVRSITIDDVTIESNKRVFSLPFASPDSARNNNNIPMNFGGVR